VAQPVLREVLGSCSPSINGLRRSKRIPSQAECTPFRKGLTAPISVALDPQGQDLIDRQAFTRVLRYLKEGQAEEALTLLEMTLGPSLVVLPPFRIAHTLHERPLFLTSLDERRR
jgi:hypothetical protein